MPARSTVIRTWPSPATGALTSLILSTSGPPNSVISMARLRRTINCTVGSRKGAWSHGAHAAEHSERRPDRPHRAGPDGGQGHRRVQPARGRGGARGRSGGGADALVPRLPKQGRGVEPGPLSPDGGVPRRTRRGAVARPGS